MDLLAKLRAEKSKELLTAEKFMTEKQRAANREPKSKINIFFKRILIISLVTLFLIYTFILLISQGYLSLALNCKKPIKSYFNAICDRDFDSYIESMPYEWRTDYQSQLLNMDYSKYDYMDVLYSDLFDIFGENMDVRLTFLSQERSDSLASSIHRSFYEKYSRSIDIEDCCIVEVAAHFSGSKFSCKAYIYCTVIRLNGKWYIIDAGKEHSKLSKRAAYLT